MFNTAIFFKTVRDSLLMLALAVCGIIGFVILFVWAMLNMGTELLEFISKFPVFQKIFEMGFGIDVSGEVSFAVLFSVSFTHAFVLALSWSVLISSTTRVTVGEVERGTADLLLTLPVTRAQVYFSTTLVWLISALCISAAPLLGIWVAREIFQPDEAIKLTRFILPAVNFFCLNVAVAAFSSMLSCFLNRRGRTIAIVVGVVLISVVLNFLEPFLTWIQSIKFLSLLSYFRPVDAVRTGEWPIAHMVVLLSLAIVCWIVGLIHFSRKDIPTAG